MTERKHSLLIQNVFLNVQHQSPMNKTDVLIGQHGIKFDNMVSVTNFVVAFYPGGGGVLPIMAYTGRLRPKVVPFFRLQVYKRVGISQVEVHKRVGKSVI